MTTTSIPTNIDDPINARILAISEDKIQGFCRHPLLEIANQAGLDLQIVIGRIGAMLEAGTIRRVRQTLMTTSLAPGALVAWQVPKENLDLAFDSMFHQDPFTGHVVIRSTDRQTAGSEYRLWTTLKVPVGYSMKKHCDRLAATTGAQKYKLLPAKKLFALGVGHVRRRDLMPGVRTNEPARVTDVTITDLSDAQWCVIMALKQEFGADELSDDLWLPRARDAGITIEQFIDIATELNQRGVIGRFSTFLEHYKKLKDGTTVTKYNALFHWSVPPGKEMAAGMEVGRHPVMTHAYWREAGKEFNNVNIMGVAHSTDRNWLLAHKSAIDQHLEEAGIEVSYTNVFWGGRSEIKPSEISPIAYRQWCQRIGVDPESMR